MSGLLRIAIPFLLAAAALAETVQNVCPSGGDPPIRRMNRDEYNATLRELLGISINAGHDLPEDAAGGQGFDNAGEVLVLSPILAEKYLSAAKEALAVALSNPQARKHIHMEDPLPGHTPEEAAQALLGSFLPRAFRRPATEGETASFLLLFRDARKRRQTYDASVSFMLTGVLISPRFLFLNLPGNADYTLTSRLSYFLQGTMPDDALFDEAAKGVLHQPEVLTRETLRLLASPKSMTFAERFTGQWLGTRALGRDFSPDGTVFPAYAANAELQGDIRLQPAVFFASLLAGNDPVTDLIDSNWTMLTKSLAALYRIDRGALPKDLKAQPLRVTLPPDSHRGGLLGMSAVLAVSSYPYRTSPVLRGKFVLDALLGTPPPPPPPNVPALEEHPDGSAHTVRERLARHRANPVCAGCHSRIDPPGFALENFDALGQWRTEDAGQPIDNTGQWPDGTTFSGPDELKASLMARKEIFVRNLTRRMLGYALGRGLNPADSCAVDAIVAHSKDNGYRSQMLVEEIVLSSAFLNPAKTPAAKAEAQAGTKQ